MFEHLLDTNLWITIHHHKYGTTIYTFTAHTEPPEEEIVKSLGIDFEPDKDEWLETYTLYIGDKIKHIET